MRKLGRRDALKMALAAPIVMAAGGLRAQGSWPNKPVRIVMPFGAGGAGDAAGRVIFHKVSEILKQPVLIENRTGGASVVAANAVATAPKDGYTWLFSGSQQIIVPLVLTNVDVDYRTFIPVTQCCNYPQTIAVQPDSPIKTVADLIAAAKASPGRLRCGTAAPGNMNHLAMEELQRRAGIKFVHVPYRVSVEGPRDLMGGQIDILMLTLSTLLQLHKTNKMRIIAVTPAQRSKAAPEIPTIAENGFPGFDMGEFAGLFAGAGTPEPLMAAMQQAVAAAATDKSVTDILVPQGTDPIGSTTADFVKLFEAQREVLTRLVKEANINFG